MCTWGVVIGMATMCVYLGCSHWYGDYVCEFSVIIGVVITCVCVYFVCVYFVWLLVLSIMSVIHIFIGVELMSIILTAIGMTMSKVSLAIKVK